MAKNTGYTAEIKGEKLVITVDLKNAMGLSSSGKSMLIASSGPGEVFPDGVKLNLNVYKKA